MNSYGWTQPSQMRQEPLVQGNPMDEEERKRRIAEQIAMQQMQQQQQMQAPPPQAPQAPPQMQGNPIPLNRAGGESYDGGQQMTMQEAQAIAGQYGHVAARISSGAIDPNDPNPVGVWGVPTENGWIPVEQLAGGTTPTEQWSGGPRPESGTNPNLGTTRTPPISLADVVRGPYEAPTPTASTPIMGAIDQWRGGVTPAAPNVGSVASSPSLDVPQLGNASAPPSPRVDMERARSGLTITRPRELTAAPNVMAQPYGNDGPKFSNQFPSQQQEAPPQRRSAADVWAEQNQVNAGIQPGIVGGMKREAEPLTTTQGLAPVPQDNTQYPMWDWRFWVGR